jgi:hypothetical protein
MERPALQGIIGYIDAFNRGKTRVRIQTLVVARIEFGDFGSSEGDFISADSAVNNGGKELTISHNRPLSPTLRSGRDIDYSVGFVSSPLL